MTPNFRQFVRFPRSLVLTCFLVALLIYPGCAQEIGFKEEVATLVKAIDQKGWEPGGVVVTGSSSIRYWVDLDKEFPKAKPINTGFGGSHSHELLHYLEPLVIRYAPKKVFIYIGENDVNAGKSTRQTMTEISLIVDRLQEALPGVQLYFIGLKPSPSRIDKKGQMMALNAELNSMALSKENVTFISVWEKMLDKEGNPNEKLFGEDRLHMNEKGYKIWRKSLKAFL